MNILISTAHIGALDIKSLLTQLGHRVHIVSYSDHNFIRGWSTQPKDYREQFYIDENYCEEWYSQHRTFHNYDLYIVFYPPPQTFLFIPSNKPCIMVLPVRYEYYFSQNKHTWDHIDNLIRKYIDRGQLTLVANGKYDQKYAEHYLDRKVELIESICDYNGEPHYTGKNNKWILDAPFDLDGYDNLTKLPPNYKYEDLCDYKGVVHFPYNVSTMSWYERYYLNLPHIVPSIKWALDFSPPCFKEIEWTKNNQRETWNWRQNLHLADFYQYPLVEQVDNMVELTQMMKLIDCNEISGKMKLINKERKNIALEQWKKVLEG